MKRLLRVLMVVGVCLMVSACVTWRRGDEPATPAAPAITPSMPLPDAIAAGMRFGNPTADEVIQLIRHRDEWPDATRLLEGALADGHASLSSIEIAHGVQMYNQSPKATGIKVFKALSRDERLVIRQLSWQVAAAMPSAAMAEAVDAELTRALERGEEKETLVPAMAMAIQSNKMRGVYTLARAGLMTTGHESFVRAMAELDPARASSDFMEYLALAPADELRQMTMTSVNVFACLEALRFMTRRPPAISHPKFGQLFLYSASRNQSLAELANAVLDGFYGKNNETLAMLLARHPVWVQVAFVEGTRQRMTGALGVFLDTLKETTAHEEVVEEINEIRR